MTPIEFRFVHEKRDFARFFREAASTTLVVAGAIVTALVAIGLLVPAAREATVFLRPPFVIPVGTFALLLLMLLGVQPELFARAAMRTRGDATTYWIDDEGIRVASSRWTARFAWADMLKARETRSAFGLYPSRVEVHMLPKRAMTPDQQHALRDELRARKLVR